MELGRFSPMAARTLWEPMKRFMPSNALLRTMQGRFEFGQKPSPTSQDSREKTTGPMAHVVDDAWPSRDTMIDLYNSSELENSLKKFRTSRTDFNHGSPSFVRTTEPVSSAFTYSLPLPRSGFVIMLSEVREHMHGSSEGSTVSISQEPGLGVQRMTLNAFELWLEGLRHALVT